MVPTNPKSWLCALAITLSANTLSVNSKSASPDSIDGSASNLIHALGPQGVNLLKLQNRQKSHNAKLFVQDASSSYGSNLGDVPEDPFPEFLPYYFEQPLDHFTETNHTFGQRYWVSTRHYTPGAPSTPVFVLDGGETSGEDRLPFLDTGIVDILAAATGGVGVILEHRYYGNSIPVANFSTDSLRWLNNAQAAADSANFMANVKFPGIHEDLTAPGKPWIYYGGSYAGARAAHMRVLYPNLVFGAIASSGVTHATLSNWEYMEVIRLAAEPKCAAHLVGAIESIDSILALSREGGRRAGMGKMLKGLFGLASLENDEDFVSLLEAPLSSWQSKNWDPSVGSTVFDSFCAALVKPPFPFVSSPAVVDAPFGDASRLVKEEGLVLDYAVFNYAKYIREKYVSLCPEGMTVEECFGTYNDAQYQGTSLDQTWRLWMFQVCTEWGYFTTAPPDQKQPRIISRLLDLVYETRICAQAFPPGKHFRVPAMPNITAVNALGDFEIAADRLAIIDGEVDPWRPDTPHSQYAPDRKDTLTRPFKLIPNGVHHYDEFGLRNTADEPEEIKKIHGEMIVFVKDWLKQWKA
ncbi:peptidase S28 [Athelia psychrophila]|uniref:Peptidase S28 n=1 Tax=Athelia psychrophila TaxID=1759441 RepID=A0A166UCX7_9AGAM|nr:peptidase S28 [Fibularhizoctonia sp. CBS 109695]